MGNSWHKYLTKFKPFLIPSGLLIIVVTVVLNMALAIDKGRIIKALNNSFFTPLSIDRIYYLPPNFIIIKNFNVFRDKTSTDNKVLTVPLVTADISLTRALRGNFYIQSLRCSDAYADREVLFNFTKDNFKKLWDFLLQFPRQNFAFSVKQLRLRSLEKDGSAADIINDVYLRITGDALSVSGKSGETAYLCRGTLKAKGAEIERLEFKNKGLDCQLWGSMNSDTAEVKGFIIYEPIKLLILDIDSQVNFAFPRIGIERFNFTANNNPVKLSGDINFNDPFSCNLQLLSSFRSISKNRKDALKNISLTASLLAQNNSLKINGSMAIDFPEQKGQTPLLRSIELQLKDLIIPLTNLSLLNISAQQTVILCKTDSESCKIDLKGLRAEASRPTETESLIKFHSPFCGGMLEGSARLEITQPLIYADIRIKNIEAQKLEELIVHFSKVHGKAFARMSFINRPKETLKGTIYIRDGELKDFEFLKWLAGMFNIPELKSIPFSAARANFVVDGTGSNLTGMWMKSDDARINGDFKLGASDSVSSKITVDFQRNLLQRSQKFAALLGLLPKDLNPLEFDFRLSGNLHKINFQWLETDFKEHLRERIPNFIQRGLEAKIEKAVQSITSP